MPQRYAALQAELEAGRAKSETLRSELAALESLALDTEDVTSARCLREQIVMVNASLLRENIAMELTMSRMAALTRGHQRA
jgi:hypothetical protein